MVQEAKTSYESNWSKLLIVSGKKIHFLVWEEKFLAKSHRKGYSDTLLGNTTIPKESDIIDETTIQGKEGLLIRKANDDGFEHLLLGIDGEKKSGRVAFQIVRSSKTTDSDKARVIILSGSKWSSQERGSRTQGSNSS